MACRVCFRPKRKEYATALLLAHSGKPFSAERIERISQAAGLTAADFQRDLAALPTMADLPPVGTWPAPVGLVAARDFLLGVR